jgi:Spy/CpxP family protein refolding chaperone
MQHFVIRILTLLWAAGIVLTAQTSTPQTMTAGSGPGGPSLSYHSEFGVPGFLPPTPGMDPVAFWAAYLNLDAGQQASVKTILSDQQTASNALRTNLDRAHSALSAATKANSADSEIDRLSANLGAVIAQTTAVQAKAYARFYALLSPDQKQKFDSVPMGVTVSVSDGGAAGTSVKQ